MHLVGGSNPAFGSSISCPEVGWNQHDIAQDRKIRKAQVGQKEGISRGPIENKSTANEGGLEGQGDQVLTASWGLVSRADWPGSW